MSHGYGPGTWQLIRKLAVSCLDASTVRTHQDACARTDPWRCIFPPKVDPQPTHLRCVELVQERFGPGDPALAVQLNLPMNDELHDDNFYQSGFNKLPFGRFSTSQTDGHQIKNFALDAFFSTERISGSSIRFGRDSIRSRPAFKVESFSGKGSARHRCSRWTALFM